MKNWNELAYYAGFDWAGNHHDVVHSLLDGWV